MLGGEPLDQYMIAYLCGKLRWDFVSVNVLTCLSRGVLHVLRELH